LLEGGRAGGRTRGLHLFGLVFPEETDVAGGWARQWGGPSRVRGCLWDRVSRCGGGDVARRPWVGGRARPQLGVRVPAWRRSWGGGGAGVTGRLAEGGVGWAARAGVPRAGRGWGWGSGGAGVGAPVGSDPGGSEWGGGGWGCWGKALAALSVAWCRASPGWRFGAGVRDGGLATRRGGSGRGAAAAGCGVVGASLPILGGGPTTGVWRALRVCRLRSGRGGVDSRASCGRSLPLDTRRCSGGVRGVFARLPVGLCGRGFSDGRSLLRGGGRVGVFCARGGSRWTLGTGGGGWWFWRGGVLRCWGCVGRVLVWRASPGLFSSLFHVRHRQPLHLSCSFPFVPLISTVFF